MIKAILLSFLFVAGPATVDALADTVGTTMQKNARVVDVMPDLWAFVESGKAAPREQRRALYARFLTNRHPAVFTEAVIGRGDVELYYDMLGPLLPRMRDVHEQLPGLVERGLGTLRAALLDFQTPDVYFTPSLLNFDGTSCTIDGRRAVLFGIDTIAHVHPPGRSLEPLILHELFHAHHEFNGDGTVIRTLWIEGLATYASHALAPDARAADVLLSDELAAVDDAKLAAMAKETLRYLDSRDQKVLARFFRNDDLPDRQVAWPRRFGYLVGYNVAARLGRHKNLQQLTALTPAEADGPIRATLRALARRGGDSSNRRPRP